jgi:hypothetical protein
MEIILHRKAVWVRDADLEVIGKETVTVCLQFPLETEEGT